MIFIVLANMSICVHRYVRNTTKHINTYTKHTTSEQVSQHVRSHLASLIYCSIGADRSGGGGSGAPGDVTRRGLQTPYVIFRMTRQSSNGSLTKSVISIRGNYPPVLYWRPTRGLNFLTLELAILVFFSRSENFVYNPVWKH